jgi:hypothetical protein
MCVLHHCILFVSVLGCAGCGLLEPNADIRVTEKVMFLPRSYGNTARMKEVLSRIPPNLPTTIPLRLPELLRHINRQLTLHGLSIQVGFYIEPDHDPRREQSWKQLYYSTDLVKLQQCGMANFGGTSESEIRSEINQGSVKDLLYKLKTSYFLCVFFVQGHVVLTPSVGPGD